MESPDNAAYESSSVFFPPTSVCLWFWILWKEECRAKKEQLCLNETARLVDADVRIVQEHIHAETSLDRADFELLKILGRNTEGYQGWDIAMDCRHFWTQKVLY